jgi:hypothetical protein
LDEGNDSYLVTAFVPSEMACLESSPGKINRTEVWISRDEMVDFLLYEASLEASPAILSKISLTKELRINIALLETIETRVIDIVSNRLKNNIERVVIFARK